MSKQANLQKLIEPIVTNMGYELVGVEFLSQGKHSILRTYIDKPGGINVDDCSLVSYQVSAMLDVEDPIHGEYSLEISSPGLDRPLFSIAHFEQFCGQKCKIRTKIPVEGQRKFTGIIKSVSENRIEIEMQDKSACIPFDVIEKANLVPEF